MGKLEQEILDLLKGSELDLDDLGQCLDISISILFDTLDDMKKNKLITYNPKTGRYSLPKPKREYLKIDKDIVYKYVIEHNEYNEYMISVGLKASGKEVRAYLDELSRDGLLYHSFEYNIYAPVFEAEVRVKAKGYAFAKVVDKDIEYYISEDNLANVFDGDICNIYPTGEEYILKEAAVKNVIKRSHTYVVGKLCVKGKKYPKYKIESVMESFKVMVDVKPEDLNGAYIGAIVTADITYTNGYTIWGKITQVVGSKNDPGIEISEIALEYGFKTAFSEETIEEVESIPESVNIIDYPVRRDFRNKNVITIDGDDSKDFDDAVYLETLPNGNYSLEVHIADVSEYVKENKPLDIDALSRGTSVYLADRVIPMLPKELSNGICSLNEGVDRLVLSCIMEYTKTGKLVNYEIVEGVINSHHRMTYNKVNKILYGDLDLIEEYKDIYPMLLEMENLSNLIRDIRRRKGGIEFESEEYKFKLNLDGSPKSVEKRTTDKAENLIEDFMLAANETVAYHMSIMNLPAVYRIHEKPDQEKLHAVFSNIASMKVPVKNIQNDIHPHEIQTLLESVKDHPNKMIIHTLLLRSMMKAKYSRECLGHYGLAMNYYCHFTSPIRRYPDLMTHRMIKKLYLHPNDLDSDIVKYNAIIPEIALRNSESERKAVDCERAVDDMLYAWYMEKHINDIYPAVISSITNFGMFAELSDGTEGLIAYRSLKGYFDYDERTMTASNGKTTYHLGDKICIRVKYASRIDRKIDFEIED